MGHGKKCGLDMSCGFSRKVLHEPGGPKRVHYLFRFALFLCGVFDNQIEGHAMEVFERVRGPKAAPFAEHQGGFRQSLLLQHLE